MSMVCLSLEPGLLSSLLPSIDTHPPSLVHVPTSPTSVKSDFPGNVDPAACRVEGLVSAIRVSPFTPAVVEIVLTLMARSKHCPLTIWEGSQMRTSPSPQSPRYYVPSSPFLYF